LLSSSSSSSMLLEAVYDDEDVNKNRKENSAERLARPG
jgi:hypothetical protein